MPSVEEAAAEELPATAAKTPAPYVTDFHADVEGIVLAVQVIPSVDVVAFVV